MPHPATRSVPAFMPDALTASLVGTWETDTLADHTRSDTTTAALFGLDPFEAAEGLPLAVYARAIHPDDRVEFYDALGRVREHGGLFVIEYRTRPAPGVVRWVLARGRYERVAQTGNIIGRGIVIDITASKLDGRAEDRAFFLLEEAETPLERLAARAIEVRHAIDDVEGTEKPALHHAIDALLWAIGRALARYQDRPKQRHN